MDHIHNLLPDYVKGRLDKTAQAEVERHLGICAICRGELQLVSEVFHLVEESQPAGPPDGYFSTVLPHVRARLDPQQHRSVLSHPLIMRLAAPLAAGALVLLLLIHLPFPASNTETSQNPLQPVLRGVETDDLVEIMLDQIQRLDLNTVSESETSALLGSHILHADHLLAEADAVPSISEPLLGTSVPEGLEDLSDADVDVLVQRLGEREML